MELTDAELETGLGITHPMHRKKLRLAIEEHRNPDMVRHPAISQLGHDWVASEWLPDLGLSQVIVLYLYGEYLSNCGYSNAPRSDRTECTHRIGLIGHIRALDEK